MLLSLLSFTPVFCQQTKDQIILQIQNLISTGNLAGADQLLDQAVRQYPGDSGLLNLRGIVAVRKGDVDLARNSFQEALRRSPKFTAAYLNLARLYQEDVKDARRTEEALSVYEHVLKYEPGNEEAQYQSVFLLMEQGDYRESLEHLARLKLEARSTPQALSVTVADLAGLHEQQPASQAASRLASHPDLSVPDVQQALPALANGKRYDLIVQLLEELKRRNSLPAEMLSSLGSAYAQTGKLKEARSTLEEAFASFPASAPLLIELAKVAYQERDYMGSLGYLAHAQILQPNDPGIAYSFGVVCLELELLGESQKSFKKAVDLAPENASYNYAAGITTGLLRDPGEAVPYLEKYAELRPEDPRGELAVGATLFRAKDYDSASSWLAKAAAHRETATKAHYYQGCIANEQGRTDDAIRDLQEALSADPKYVDALAELGRSYMLRKNYPQAEQELDHALAIDPNHYLANFVLLTVYTRSHSERREQQAKRFEEVQKLLTEKKDEYLRVIEIRPLDPTN